MDQLYRNGLEIGNVFARLAEVMISTSTGVILAEVEGFLV